jgi:hypothetical protein
MIDYLLRQVPSGLWQDVKAKVEREGWRSARWVIVELLRRWVAGDVDLRDTSASTAKPGRRRTK